MSLNRYLKSHTLQFHSVYQSDTAFLIIPCKDKRFTTEAYGQTLKNTEKQGEKHFFTYICLPTTKTKAMKEIKLEIRIHSLQYDELTPQDRELMDKAKEATSRSYAPYSKLS